MGQVFDRIGATAYDRYIKGQITDQNAVKLDTFMATEQLPLGRFVVRVDGKKKAALPKETSVVKDFIGMVISKNNLWTPYIPVGQGAPVGKIGRFAVLVHGGCNAGDTAHIIIKDADDAEESLLGEVRGSAGEEGTTVELNGVKFNENAADGELVEIVIDGNLTIATGA